MELRCYTTQTKYGTIINGCKLVSRCMKPATTKTNYNRINDDLRVVLCQGVRFLEAMQTAIQIRFQMAQFFL